MTNANEVTVKDRLTLRKVYRKDGSFFFTLEAICNVDGDDLLALVQAYNQLYMEVTENGSTEADTGTGTSS